MLQPLASLKGVAITVAHHAGGIKFYSTIALATGGVATLLELKYNSFQDNP
jgi:hypothetical protein